MLLMLIGRILMAKMYRVHRSYVEGSHHQIFIKLIFLAYRFIQRNSLPEVYREQIVQFIVQNTAVTMPVDMSVNLDPFTGGGAYIPSSSSNNPNQSLQSPTNVTGGGADPFTGKLMPCKMEVIRP